MTTYIVIDEQAYETNTDEEITEAREALREAGLEVAVEYCGLPDGLGDSYANGNKLFAFTGRVIGAAEDSRARTVGSPELQALPCRSVGRGSICSNCVAAGRECKGVVTPQESFEAAMNARASRGRNDDPD